MTIICGRLHQKMTGLTKTKDFLHFVMRRRPQKSLAFFLIYFYLLR